MKKQIIYSDDFLFDEDAREEYQEWKREETEDDTYEVSDEEWYYAVTSQLCDERMNLFNCHVDGVIIAFGMIGTWRGRFQAYKIYDSNVNGILHSSCEHNEWYGDGYNIRCNQSHHDGTNYILYRVAKDMETAERIGEQIYNNEIDEKQFRKKTKSLYPYVARVYGWKEGRFHK